MTRKRNLLIILCIIGLSALVFSQCLGTGGSGSSSTTNGQGDLSSIKDGSDSTAGDIIIKASVAMDPKEFELFSRMAKQFSELHEGITIQVNNIAVFEAYEVWKKAGQMGEAPDLMLLDNHWIQEFAALGFLQPVDEFFSSDQQNGRISTLMNQVKWNGYIWGVPKDVDPYILAWNKRTAADNKLEHAPESGDELLAWNKQLLNPAEGKFGVYADPADPYAFIAAASSITGAWTGKEKVWADQAEAEKRLTAFFAPQEEAWNGKLYPQNFPVSSPSWSPWEQLSLGKIAAMVTTVSAFKLHMTDNIAIASIPVIPDADQRAVWLKGRSFTVSSRTPHAKILMDWIKEMTTPEAGIEYWNASKVLPAQIPAYNLAPLRGDEHINSFDWLITQGRVLPNDSETSKNLQGLHQELLRLWKGEITLKQLIELTEAAWHLAGKP
ncbi:MAG: extracellular solute-binding protein [Paenibacillaceae bacterium]|nr:extracellular solute-binding protein [Paenibacillaceae bacterium]